MSKHFLAACLATPWAMDPAYMKTYGDILVRAYLRKDADLPVLAGPAAGPSGGSQPKPGGNIGLVSIMGPIVSHAADLGPCEAGTSYDSIRAQLRAGLADDSIGSILLAIDSPGGSVFGCMELADEIRASAKPITAVASYCAASAAYWLGSAASEFYVSPSGQVGSIGVWMAHQDVSSALEKEGIVTTLISAGRYKVEGNPFSALDDEARANMQSSVDDFYTSFVKAVAKGRNVSVDTVRSGMGEGRMLSASDALKAGMVDGVATFDEVVAKMQRKGRTGGAARARAQVAISALI